MNKKEKLAFLKALENNSRISELWYNKDILHRGWDDSIWFGGSVLSFIVDNRYVYSCIATGEIRLTHYPSNDYVTEKNDYCGRVREFLLKHNLTTDTKISKAENKGKLYFGNNNWFEDVIYDLQNKKYLGEYLDTSDGPLSWETPEQLLEYLDQVIQEE